MDASQSGGRHRSTIFYGSGTGCRRSATPAHGLAIRHAVGGGAVTGLRGESRACAGEVENLSTGGTVAGTTHFGGVTGMAAERCHPHGTDVRSALRVRSVSRSAGRAGQFFESGAPHAHRT